MEIASKIDHTLLKPVCTERDIISLCEEALTYKFYSVCVPPIFVGVAGNELKGSAQKVVTVIGFPLGYNTIQTKLFETEEALEKGAGEIDLVINLSAIKSGKILNVYDEVEKIAALAHQSGVFLKTIIETAYLNEDEMRIVCGICVDAGADFIKTSTGFSPRGASIEDIKFIRNIVPERIKIKASGGIKSYHDASSFLEVGADRLGTSSGVKIVKEAAEVTTAKLI